MTTSTVVDLTPATTRKRRAPRAETARRQGWTGGLSDGEVKLPGSRLLSLLFQEANDRGMQLQELASSLGCTYGYIAHLRTGIRDVPNVSDEFVAACARYLRLPKLAVMAAAGKLSIEDLYEPGSLEKSVDAALRLMQSDPHWGGLVPTELFQGSLEMKALVVRLYEKAESRQLLPDEISAGEIEGFF